MSVAFDHIGQVGVAAYPWVADNRAHRFYASALVWASFGPAAADHAAHYDAGDSADNGAFGPGVEPQAIAATAP